VRHIAPGHSPKSTALRTTVRTQFEKHRNETDPTIIEAQKANAVRALANYMLFESGAKDKQLSKAMTQFHPMNDAGDDTTNDATRGSNCK